MINLENLALSSAVILMTAALNQEIEAPDEESMEILLDSTMRLLAIAGSIGGGFMALTFFPAKPRTDKERERSKLGGDAVRWLACSIFGGSFSPFVIEHVLPKYDIPITTSSVLALSSFLGLFAWAIASGLQVCVKKYFK